MNEFEKETEIFDEQILRFGSRKNRLLARFYRGLGSFIGTAIVAIIIALIIFLL